MQVSMEVAGGRMGMLAVSEAVAVCNVMCMVHVQCTVSDVRAGLSTGSRPGRGAAPAQGRSAAVPLMTRLRPWHRPSQLPDLPLEFQTPRLSRELQAQAIAQPALMDGKLLLQLPERAQLTC